MKIENLRALEALVKMCNKNGVRDITVDGVSIKLDGVSTDAQQPSSTKDNIKSQDTYSDEDMLYWSATAGE